MQNRNQFDFMDGCAAQKHYSALLQKTWTWYTSGMVIFGFSYQTMLCTAPFCKKCETLAAARTLQLRCAHHADDSKSVWNQRIKNLQVLQRCFDAFCYPVGCLKHGLPCPPHVVVRSSRHRVRKLVGLENSERESGMITCRWLWWAENVQNETMTELHEKQTY